MALAEKISERELEAHHIFLAAFLAGLNEMGMLNQASVNMAARRAGKYLAEYARTREDLPGPEFSTAETATKLIAFLDSILGLGTTIEIRAEGEEAICRVLSSGCRFCPKGVGEAELEGTLCPYPGLIEEFVNQLLPENEKMRLVMVNRRPLIKEGDGCLIRIS